MAKLPKRITERFSKRVSKYQNVLRIAKDRDVNESDTVSIVTDILADVFGYDKYLEVTSEFAIRGTYCDLAIKVQEKIQFLIEVKAIGIGLKENHLKQAIDYAANHGVQWVILTNGEMWKIYKMRFEQRINYDLVCIFDFLEINLKKEEDKGVEKSGKALSKDTVGKIKNVVKAINSLNSVIKALNDLLPEGDREDLKKSVVDKGKDANEEFKNALDGISDITKKLEKKAAQKNATKKK